MGRLQKFTKNTGVRHIQVLLLFLGYMIAFSLRTIMSVAIVAITDVDSKRDDIEIYNWTISQQSLIQSSFMWGCLLSQVPLGFIMNNIGYHKLLCFGILCSSAATIFIPVLATYTGWIGVLCSRFLVGIAQGSLVPGIKGLMSKWIPLTERAQLGSLILNSPELGNMIAMLLSGVLADSSLGWPSIFYVFGTAGFLWSVMFYWLGSDSPAAHKTISLKEREYILTSLGEERVKKRAFPWKAAFSSMAVLSLLVTSLCNAWNYYMIITELPLYMKTILHFSISQSGMFSALSLLVKWLFAFPVAWVSDYCLRKGVSVAIIRKTCNSIALWGPGAALLALCITRTNDQVISVSLMSVVIGFSSAVSCGQEINEIDIAPNFTGILSSITNSAAVAFAFWSPIVFSYIVTDTSNIDQWNIMFYISAFLYFIGNLAFVVFGKTEIQPWNGEVDKEIADEPIKKLSVISRISSIHEH